MPRQSREKFGPFGRTAGISDVTGDEDVIERFFLVNSSDFIEQLRESAVAGWAGPSALDPKAILLANDMNVGQMRNAP